jgi:hypothetical protein
MICQQMRFADSSSWSQRCAGSYELPLSPNDKLRPAVCWHRSQTAGRPDPRFISWSRRMHRFDFIASERTSLYHYYLGDPIEVLMLHVDGPSERVVVGPDLRGGQRVQLLIPGNTFHTARVIPGSFRGWICAHSSAARASDQV